MRAARSRRLSGDGVITSEITVLGVGENLVQPGDASDHAAAPGAAEDHQLLGIAHRQLSQEQLVREAEDGGVGADAEGQSEHRDDGEAGRLAQHADSEAQILPAGFQERFPAGGADFFLGNVRAATFQAHGAESLFAAQALLQLFLGRHFEETVYFFFEFLAGLFLSKQGTETVSYSSQDGHH